MYCHGSDVQSSSQLYEFDLNKYVIKGLGCHALRSVVFVPGRNLMNSTLKHMTHFFRNSKQVPVALNRINGLQFDNNYLYPWVR